MSSAAELRAAGLRVTTPRLAVLSALHGAPGHPTAEDLFQLVEGDGVHLATVYRTLESFVEVGLATHVHLDTGATAYHLASAHLHARCHHCGTVVDLPADLLDEARARVLADSGFQLDPGHIALSGTCQACAHHHKRFPTGH